MIRYALDELDDLLPALAAGEEPTTPNSIPQADDSEVEAFLDAHTATEYPRALRRAVEAIDATVSRNGGARHPSLRMYLWQVLSEAAVGAYPAREAVEEGFTAWRRHVDGETRPPHELRDLLRWLVPQVEARPDLADVRARLDDVFYEVQMNPPPASSNGATPAEPATERFRRWSVGDLLAEDRTFHWDIVGMLAQRTYGLDAGELKTLKSYFGMARAVGLAAGVPVLGKWTVPERRRVLMFVAEGGRIPFTSRLERMAQAHGVALADLDGWLAVIDDVGPLNSKEFRDALAFHLRDFEPALVHLDPVYPFWPPDISPNQYTEVGRLLTATHLLCAEHQANLWVTAHMNQNGQGFDLKRVSGAGHGEWGDSWALLKHRVPPDVDAGRFRLALALGSRQWGGTTWDLDLNIGRFDPDLGLHDGPITWNVRPASTAGGGADDPVVDVKLEVLRVGRRARKPTTRQAWLARVERRNELKRTAFDELVDDGQILQVGAGQAPTYEVKKGC